MRSQGPITMGLEVQGIDKWTSDEIINKVWAGDASIHTCTQCSTYALVAETCSPAPRRISRSTVYHVLSSWSCFLASGHVFHAGRFQVASGWCLCRHEFEQLLHRRSDRSRWKWLAISPLRTQCEEQPEQISMQSYRGLFGRTIWIAGCVVGKEFTPAIESHDRPLIPLIL